MDRKGKGHHHSHGPKGKKKTDAAVDTNEHNDESETEIDCNDNHKGSKKKEGYCHFNESGNVHAFSLNLFGHDLNIYQDPGSRHLGHGAVVWDAAVVFAKYMEHDPKQFASDSLQGKRILELGSGCGLAGIAMMMKGADMTMTDLPQVVESLTSVNASTLYGQLSTKGSGSFPNPLKPPHIVSLDWNDYERLSNPSSGLSAPYDIVLLTDCVFSASLAPALIGVIKFACGPRSVVYCCHEIRDEEANAIFLEEFGKLFHFKRIPHHKLHPDYTNNLIELIVGKPIRKVDKHLKDHTIIEEEK